ncbi:MAG: hypothetical protein LBH67_03155 [Rickettsia sp.]|nr:hypothetical protein [Rickettsia sp.]
MSISMITLYAEGQLIVRNITPPKLEAANFSEEIICYRPTRLGIPNMTVALEGDKVIAHNYGHSGSGWALALGSIAYVNSLLQKSEYVKDLQFNTPITVIGAGVDRSMECL